jgi:flagellar M-ring protein FliF
VTPFRPLATGEVVEPPTSQIALSWLATNWSSVAMAGLAMFSLVMLRSMARPALPPPSAPALPPPPPPAVEKESDPKKAEPEKHGSRLKRRLGSGQSLRDELAEMVREDPDTAANILRSWISNAT